jgi:copper homeostasis protein
MTEPKSTRLPLLELCAGGIDDVLLAASAGVDRIELNSGMAVGGLTPSAGLVSFARKEFSGPIIAMIRPRESGFCYSKPEFHQMLREAELMLEAGIDGLAFGCLLPDGSVDVQSCQQMCRECGTATLVFHKAFDATPDLFNALKTLTDCGINRILTSGGKRTAADGIEVIRKLHELAGRHIEILPGGGIRAANVCEIMNQTGCLQVHTSVREWAIDLSTERCPQLDFGSPAQQPGAYGRASADQLSELIAGMQAGHEKGVPRCGR